MSAELLPATPLRRVAIAASIPKSSSTKSHRPFLTQRTYIPNHIYKHPAALLLELNPSMKEIYQILPQIIKHGLYNEHYFQTKLVSLFCKNGSLIEAARIFEPIEEKHEALYHTILKAYAKKSSLDDAVSFFSRMRYDKIKPVVYNFTNLLKICGDKADLRRGKEIHGHLITSAFSSDLFAMTGVVNMYAKCRKIEEAHKMFDRMPERDLISWNTIISGYAQNRMAAVALDLVIRMQEEGKRPDSITLVSILPAVVNLGELRIGRAIHGYTIRAGFESLVNVSTALLGMYSKCGSIRISRLIFEGMKHRNVVSWNSMIDGYVQGEKPEEAIKMFRRMLDEGVEPTVVTVMGALAACADLGDLEQGRFVHRLLNQLQLGSRVSVMNSLISMYSKCKRVDIAAEMFRNLQGKTVVSWNAMILGFAQNGCVNEALSYFSEMWSQNIKPDSFTLVSVVPAVAELSVSRHAKWIHGLCIRTYFDDNVFVMTALVDVYAKCGAIHTARKLFDPMKERHVTTWNAMIDGYGTHGLGKAAVELFREMLRGKVKPNDISFLCVLSACSHSGLVDEGLEIFDLMKKDYTIEPAMDHYGVIVDLLGRAGKLDQAWKFIQEMPIEPGINVYGAMLGACKIHKNVELGEKAASKLFALNPEDGGYHVLLANIYATSALWGKMAQTRTTMEKKGLRKTPGCSVVELKHEIHSFFSGSTDHPDSHKIYAYLEKLGDEIKAAGYIPETSSIHDVEDDIKEKLNNTHSERLAIAFGLLNTSSGTTLHIRKNLRVCGDCHEATKYISLVTKREIIVRDMHRFHHFKDGTCSCGDYW